ncbi:esterase-like activity of phytase family protein [Amycolatopsis palatopharyngis]|uniref:esterase-like activity of phytase family protein n=1 Tax=Amycolatopsis palatopharyngis TaxID=187982 RepID=UPI000E2535EE|nr:esterase-like activity of phytase family protein [Amycolatopsis palatopharyngis]
MSRRSLAAVLACAFALGLVHSPAAEAGALRSVRLIGEQTLPHRLDFQGTTVGGLSSIDYDQRTGEYVLISDDRSQLQPARFYTARMDVDARELGEVRLTGTHTFTGEDGTAYAEGSVDPEELRVDPFTGRYYWSQEGERAAGVLLDPSVREARRDGGYVRDLPIPDSSRMTEDAGPRRNLGPEGLTFAASGALVTSAMEGPLLQDGPEADTTRGALSRITVQGRRGPVFAQYAYPMEPVFAEPVPADGFAMTGVSSILAEGTDKTRYLVMERSFVAGVGNRIRIYRVDTSGATNVAYSDSLAEEDHLRPVRKRLLLDLADLGLDRVDNVEGMTWGPRLDTGERTLLLVSDDNFSPSQVTQFVALAVR